ncbi:ATP-binding protein, partial [Corallococcus llansteffanensis]
LGRLAMQEPDSRSVDEHRQEDAHGSAAVFLRVHRESLLAEWQQAILDHLGWKTPRHTSWLIDHLPELLSTLADAVESGPEALDQRLEVAHAAARMEEGFDLGEVGQEYALLRRCILRRLEAQETPLRKGELTRMEEMLDRVVTRTMTFFWETKQRILQTLDRLAEATLDDPDMETLLERLLTRLMEAALTVDTAAVLLLEGDALVVHAAVGLGTDQVKGARVPLGQLTREMVATRKPFFIRSAATDPRVLLEPLRREGLRALYGIPLMDGERLRGVAYMGSRTAFTFSDADTLLFHAVAQRASAHISQVELHAREHAARQQAEESLALLDSFLEAVPLGIAFLDLELRHVRVNGTLAAINHQPVEAHRGRTLREMAGDSLAEPIERIMRRVLERGESVQDVFLERTDAARGSTTYWQVDYFPVRTQDGALLGVGAAVVDISDHKHAEATLQQALDFREELLAILGHDLRNPLHAVTASAFMLGRAPGLDDASKRAVDRIRKSSARMGRMINDILDFARTRLGGGIPVNARHVNMDELCQGALEELQVTYPERPLPLKTRGGNLEGHWDPDRVTQVLGNLVVNALQHARSDSPVCTTLTDAGADVVMCVHNEGDPIPEDLLPRLFDPFKASRAPEESGKHRSLGLGLYIVHEIVQMHGGSVQVDSSAERGTTFTVRWPRVPPAPGHRPA